MFSYPEIHLILRYLSYPVKYATAQIRTDTHCASTFIFRGRPTVMFLEEHGLPFILNTGY